MRESSTYQAILDEGKLGEAKNTFLRLGRQRLDSPDTTISARVQRMKDLKRWSK